MIRLEGRGGLTSGLCKQLGLVLGLLLMCEQSLAAVVLQYHHVSDNTPASTSTPVELFHKHMQFLETEGYQVVPLPELLKKQSDLLNNPSGFQDPRAKQVAITFDDGYESVYTTAYPELKKRGWPFTVFVNTQPLDETWKEFVTWEQLREMAKHGATIANHTVHHEHMIRLRKDETQAQWRERTTDEVLLAEKRIEEETGQSHRILAYPFGEYDMRVMELLKTLDFVGFGQHSGPLGSLHSPQALPRFPFGGAYGDLKDFAIKASSLPLPLQRIGLNDVWVTGDFEPMLTADTAQPRLMLDVDAAVPAKSVQCFATGQGSLVTKISGQKISTLLSEALPAGRSRINCTAAAGGGRFYWFSQPFFHPDQQGQWPAE